MFEAFRANRPNATGIIQWMLNSAWPSFYWQLYDYYLLPTAAYYAAKKANEPLQLVYNYGNNQIYAVNETLKRMDKAKARIKMADLQGKEILSEEIAVNLQENKSLPVFSLPSFNSTVFLSTELLDEKNRVVADNFYWLAGKPDVYDWEKTEWYYTPVKVSADFKGLNYLLPAEVKISNSISETENEQIIETSLNNSSNRVAFFINISVNEPSGNTVYPVFWNDNYISLLPGETKILRCTIPGKRIAGGYTITMQGWNVKEQKINVTL